MARYVLAYRGGSAPEGEAAQAAVMQAWMNWFGELGPAVVDGGAPFAASSTVVAGGAVSAGAPSGLTGYSVISAETRAAAEAMAAGCPILSDGGEVDVYEVHEMG